MTKVPTDRGFVAITELPNGTKDVEVFAGRTGSELTSLFARHRGIPEVFVAPDTHLARSGNVRTTDDICEVFWDEDEQRLTVRQPVATPGLMA